MSLTDLERAADGSLLSNIAYIRGVASLNDLATRDEFIEALTRSSTDEPVISESMAGAIADRYQFIKGFGPEDPSGFQGAVFRDTTTEEFVFAITGTEFGVDNCRDLESMIQRLNNPDTGFQPALFRHEASDRYC